MSSGSAWPLQEATLIAKPIIMAMAPFCERIELAGSIRRLKPEVHDIEIVCVPKRTLMVAPVITTTDLFGDTKEEKDGKDEWQNDPGFVEAYNQHCHQNFKEAVGDVRTGKMAKGRTKQGDIQEDLFMCNLDNWGNQFLIRTGSTDFTRAVAKRWSQMGWRSAGGYLEKYNGTPGPRFLEEEELFAFLRMRTPPPNQRELTADGLTPWIL